ncbi:hypothetical protein SLA2020_366280 [Shorea laevis]
MAAVSSSLISIRNLQAQLSPDINTVTHYNVGIFFQFWNSLIAFLSFLCWIYSEAIKPICWECSPLQLVAYTNRVGKLQLCTSRRPLIVQAGYSNHGRPSSASIFVGGFVLGGLIVGTLGCVYAPQWCGIVEVPSAAVYGLWDLMLLFDSYEEKALERTRKVLAEKIAQLNSAIDGVSTQLRSEEEPNGVDVISDEVEAAI